MYGEGSGLIILDDLMCTGEETSLDECDHRGFYENDCSHREDVGIICSIREHKFFIFSGFLYPMFFVTMLRDTKGREEIFTELKLTHLILSVQ